jgi:hypothetical protein
MAYFQTKNPNLGKFWRVLQRELVAYFIAFWFILWPFGIFCDHLVYFIVIWYIFPVLVCCTKKTLATLQAPWFAFQVDAGDLHKSRIDNKYFKSPKTWLKSGLGEKNVSVNDPSEEISRQWYVNFICSGLLCKS